MTRQLATAVTRAHDSWDEMPPEWVLVLAKACDETSQARAAKAIGYSAAVVSTVLANSYRGDLAKVEAAVMGAFANRQVDCPILGEIRADRCLTEQRRKLQANSRQAVRLWQCCRGGCPNSYIKTEPSDDQ